MPSSGDTLLELWTGIDSRPHNNTPRTLPAGCLQLAKMIIFVNKSYFVFSRRVVIFAPDRLIVKT